VQPLRGQLLLCFGPILGPSQIAAFARTGADAMRAYSDSGFALALPTDSTGAYSALFLRWSFPDTATKRSHSSSDSKLVLTLMLALSLRCR
jgi:hypothetical protein